jgi:hypothetical protein
MHLLPNRTKGAIIARIAKLINDGELKEVNSFKLVKKLVGFLNQNKFSVTDFHNLTEKFGYKIHYTAISKLIKYNGNRKATNKTVEIIESTINKFYELKEREENGEILDIQKELDSAFKIEPKSEVIDILPELDLFTNEVEDGLVNSLEKSLKQAKEISAENFILKNKIKEFENRLFDKQIEDESIISENINLKTKIKILEKDIPKLIDENRILRDENRIFDEENAKLLVKLEELTEKNGKNFLSRILGKNS